MARRRLLSCLLLCAAVAITRGDDPYAPILPMMTVPTLPTPRDDTPYMLTVDRLLSPALGIDTDAPLLAWAAPSRVRSMASVNITVLSTPAAQPVWSVLLPGSHFSTPYRGVALTRASRYDWSVAITDAATGTVFTSDTATFVTSLQGATVASPVWSNGSMYTLLRGAHTLQQPAANVALATAFVTASPQMSPSTAEVDNSKLTGAYKLWVNAVLHGMGPGKVSRCGPLCPVQGAQGPCTCTPEHIYDVRDITAAVVNGSSAAGGVVIAVAAFNYPPSDKLPIAVNSSVLVEVHIVFQDGSVQVLASQGGVSDWRAWDGDAYMNPSGNFGDGTWYVSPQEMFDARAEPVGWRDATFNASAWPLALAVAPYVNPLVARPGVALEVTESPATVRPASSVHDYGYRWFVDFGVEFTGGVCVDATAGVDGFAVDMQLGEEVVYGANGTLSVLTPPRSQVKYAQTWTLRNGSQTICMHEWAQFRYVELTAVNASALLAPMGLTVRAWVVYHPAPFVPLDAYSSSSPLLDVVYGLSWYTRTAQGGDMYFDHVRQRVEELTIDLLQQYRLSAEWSLQPYTIEYVLNNRPFELGWAEWPPLAIFSVYEIYKHSGDLTLFSTHYAQLRNFTELSLIGSDGLWTCPTGSTSFNCNNAEVDWPPSARDGFVFTPTNTVVNAIVYRAMVYFSTMAAAIGNASDAALFASTAATLRAAMNALLWNSTRGTYMDGLTTSHAAWHSNVFALGMGVPTDDMTPAVAAAIASRVPAGNASVTECFPSSVWPTQWVLEGLYTYYSSDHGALALSMLTCNTTNGWWYMRINNATQAPEAWGVDVKGNLEWGMTWGAAPADVIPRLLAGVSIDMTTLNTTSPAVALVRPQPGALAQIAATVPTRVGIIAVNYTQTLSLGASHLQQQSWATVAVDAAGMTVSLPGAVVATACLPAAACANGIVCVNAQAVQASMLDDYACVSLTAGTSSLACPCAAAVADGNAIGVRVSSQPE